MNNENNNLELNLSKKTKRVINKLQKPLIEITENELIIKYKISEKSLSELQSELKKRNIMLKNNP